MDNDRRDARTWAQEWSIRQRNLRIIKVLAIIAIIIALYFVIHFITVTATRTTFHSVEEMRAAMQGRYETDYCEDIEIIGDDVTLTYYEISHYDPSSDNKEIIIPEVYEEYPVKGLGGYVGRGAPGPFHIELKGINSSAHVGPSDGSFSWYTEGKNLEYIYYDLVLNIGPNIREIFASQAGIESNGYLHLVRVFVNCASDNPKFYSENGVLYNKDGSIVEGFLYWNQSYQ